MGDIELPDIRKEHGKLDDMELARTIMQEERLNLVKQISDGDKNISDLAGLLNLDRATVSYHLDILESAGIVHSDYKMLKEPHSKGRVGRFYTIDRDNLNKAMKALEKVPQIVRSR